jgi:hypothetical protein
MFRSILCIALAAGVGGAGAFAADDEPSVSGKIVGLYVQTARHLLIEVSVAGRSAAHRAAPGTVIADIRFAKPLDDGRSGTLASVDADCVTDLDPGDVVRVALVASRGGKHAAAPVRRSDEVRIVEAKYHTDTAQAFGQPALPAPVPLAAKGVKVAELFSRDW